MSLELANWGTKLKLHGDLLCEQMEVNGTGYVNNLNVPGKITTGELEVKIMKEWKDKVFDQDYLLPNLEEVEDYIRKYHHLRDIPAESEVLVNGYNVGEMDALLLQKIEELTLYIIEQQKEIDKLKTDE